jgi:hypothetical protein
MKNPVLAFQSIAEVWEFAAPKRISASNQKTCAMIMTIVETSLMKISYFAWINNAPSTTPDVQVDDAFQKYGSVMVITIVEWVAGMKPTPTAWIRMAGESARANTSSNVTIANASLERLFVMAKMTVEIARMKAWCVINAAIGRVLIKNSIVLRMPTWLNRNTNVSPKPGCVMVKLRVRVVKMKEKSYAVSLRRNATKGSSAARISAVSTLHG